MRFLLYLTLSMTANSVYAQPSDFLALKKNGRTVESYYAGSHIVCTVNTGTHHNALINRIFNDSLYLQEFEVRLLPTTFGTYIRDTTGSFRFKYHYKQIVSLDIKKQKFNWAGSGASLMGGGLLLIIGSGVVYLADRDNFSPGLLAAAGALTGAGMLINKSVGQPIYPGKRKYTLEYIDMTP